MNLFVRGDLRSEFGAARHLRDQLNLFFLLFLKESTVKIIIIRNLIPEQISLSEIISDSKAESLIKNDSSSEWVVLHHVTPDYFIRYPKCYNLGYFVWGD